MLIFELLLKLDACDIFLLLGSDFNDCYDLFFWMLLWTSVLPRTPERLLLPDCLDLDLGFDTDRSF